MSTLDLRPPDDDELLELLARAFRDEREPPPSGFVSLLVALDEQFGEVAGGRPPAPPFGRRATRIVLGLAAALVALAVGLAWTGWPPQPGTPSGLDQLRYATTSLQDDLRQGDDPSQVAQDVAALARLLDQVPPGQHAQVGAEPGRVMTQACVKLAATLAPGAALPTPCGSILALPAVRQALGAAGAAQRQSTDESGSGGTRHDGGTDDGSSTLWYVPGSGGGQADGGGILRSDGGQDPLSGTPTAGGAGASTPSDDGAQPRSSGSSGSGTTVGPTTPAGSTGSTATTVSQPSTSGGGSSDDGTQNPSTTTVPSGTHRDN